MSKESLFWRRPSKETLGVVTAEAAEETVCKKRSSKKIFFNFPLDGIKKTGIFSRVVCKRGRRGGGFAGANDI